MYAGEEETLRAALEANPNDAVAHNNLGYLMETVYKVTMAISVSGRLKKRGGWINTYIRKGDCSREQHTEAKQSSRVRQSRGAEVVEFLHRVFRQRRKCQDAIA